MCRSLGGTQIIQKTTFILFENETGHQNRWESERLLSDFCSYRPTCITEVEQIFQACPSGEFSFLGWGESPQGISRACAGYPQNPDRGRGDDEAEGASGGSEWIIYLHTCRLWLFYCVNDRSQWDKLGPGNCFLLSLWLWSHNVVKTSGGWAALP